MPTLLLADDEPMMLRAMQFRLQKDGYTVLTAADGKEALQLLETTKPDLVVTDLMMPYHNGLEIIEYCRKNQGKHLPVLVLSAVGLEQTVVKAFELGADDFMTKPFSPPELSVRVKKLLEKYAS